MDTQSLEQFNPTVAKLAEMVEATKNITATDLEDKAQLDLVRSNRIELKKARVQIEKTGKVLREEANAYAKAVIAKEKELVAIIEPEEERLAAIELEAEKLAIRKDRLEKLPVMKQRITDADLEFFADRDDDALLELDANGFEGYFNELGARKVQHDREQEEIKRQEAARILEEEAAKKKAEQDAQAEALEAERRKLDEERRQLEHEKELEAAKKKEREETEARLKKEAEDRAEREKAEAEAKAAAETAEEARLEAKKNAEQQALEKKKAYVEFLKSHGYTKEAADGFKTFDTPEGIALYKKLGVFKK